MGNNPSRPLYRENADPNVPPSLRFSRHRQMVIVTMFGKRRKYLCFSTPHSYDRFKAAGKKFGTPQNILDGGLGVPLFEFEDPYSLVRLVNGDNVRFRVSKFVLQDAAATLPHSNCSVVCQDGKKAIYKMPFCEVTRSFGEGGRSAFEYVFYTPDGTTSVSTRKHRMCLDSDARLGEWNVGWRRTSSENYDLVVLPPQARSLLDSREVRASKPSNTKALERNAIVWAKFEDVGEPFLPKLTKKLAVVTVGEVDFETDATAYGLLGVPWFSQVIACMALVQCQWIQQEGRNNRKNRTLSNRMSRQFN
ncbi:LAME_0E00936g1_1 [Lachancea meyersii CBS 8951]|uniref:LAME_0E00936g1_1 n=1 Tax=Lachancea meyersii CBS 8951 TaxID=1266667 RepID=A0A1G4JF27_9SACH|nr:LAME_0E00936g1_1 [Lachancea meyersii CBS 8951]